MAATLRDLLVHYTTKRAIRADEQEGDTGKGSFSEIFWGDVKIVYDALLDAMEEHRLELEPLCGQIVTDAGMEQIRVEDSSLCKDIMKVYYFIQGIPPEHGTNSAANPPEDQIHPFMRCMVGYVTLAKQFAPLCDFNTLVPYARAATAAMRPTYQVYTSNSACNGLDFDTLQIGHKLVGKTIQAWIHNDSTRWHEIMADYVHASCADHTTIQAGTNSGQDTHEQPDSKGAHGPISPDDLKKLAASKHELSKEDATAVLNQIQGLTDTDNIMKKLKEAIEEVESETNKKVTTAASTPSPGTHTTSSSSGSSTTSSTFSSSSPSGTSESAPAKSATAATVPAGTPVPPAGKTPQAPASPVLPATPPPPPPPSRTSEGEGTASTDTAPAQPAGTSTDATGEDECKHAKSSSAASGAETHEGSRVSVTTVPYSYPGQPSCATVNNIREHERAPSSTGTCDSPQSSSRNGSSGGVDNVLDAL
ncbi:hypothetical protein AK88_04978 [Plasmodium fragile]|uniref:Schizont-infected cell agglutination extracellular alpha domain-containing protein n=1 Tax=Plasmodium fragile TaxID=5857 RepID=A0A0D9QEE4_PLAFR|nr:uncharacterized protein AK88_04978 [Plasmodium fragile]KJP85378.1 hypothetical protein AK88_04978 [Plasmodium fragile]